MIDDYSAGIETEGSVVVGAGAVGEIETGHDRDWFAVELVAGRTYTIDLKGRSTGDGTLVDPVLRGLYDGDGVPVRNVFDDDGGEGDNSRVTFTATETGTYYIEATGFHASGGSYLVAVSDVSGPEAPPAVGAPADADSVHGWATDLGDIAGREGARFLRGSVDGEGDGIDYYRFELSEAKQVVLGLRRQDADADLYIEDAQGTVLHSSSASGTTSEALSATLLAGTYYVRIEAKEAGSNGYMFRYGVEDVDADEVARLTGAPPPDAEAMRAGGTDLGDITELDGPRFPRGRVDGVEDRIDYYRFTLSEAKEVVLGLRRQDADADLFIEDEDGTVLHAGESAGTANEALRATLLAGTYYVRIEAREEGANAYVFRYGVGEPDAEEVARLEQQGAPQAPAFAGEGYAFDLAENADGSGERVSLGSVSATDPDSPALTYSIEAGNDAGLFEVDGATGELFYAGVGEDYESGPTSFELTVRASDGELSSDTPVTVNVTGVPEAPAFGHSSYAFELAENADGSGERVSLGSVSATDPDSPALTYSIEDGNDAGLFEVDEATGALFYAGAGEDYESGVTQYELTVRASDGTLFAETPVTVTVTDVAEAPLAKKSEPEGEDLPSDRTTTGVVVVDDDPVRGQVGERDDADWFAVELEAGETYRFTVEGDESAGDGLDSPWLRGIRDPEGALVAETGGDSSETDSGVRGGRGIGTRSLGIRQVDVRSGDDGQDDELIFTAQRDGVHHVDVRSKNGDTGDYLLTARQVRSVSEPAGEDFPADRTTTGVVAVNGSATGDIERSGDQDWFAVTLDAGKSYRIDLEGSWTRPVTLRNPYLRGVHDADGSLIPGTSYDDEGIGYNSRLVFEPKTAGTYYIAAGAHGGGTGTYRVSVTDVGDDDDYRADTSTTGTVAVDGSTRAKIDYEGDRDWFAVTLEAGTTYRIDQKGETRQEGLYICQIYGIHDSSGTLLPGTMNYNVGMVGYSAVLFTPVATGTYYVAAGAFQTPLIVVTGTYDLSVSVATDDDDYTADRSTTGTVAVGGSETGNIERPNDRDWFAVTLDAGRCYRVDLDIDRSDYYTTVGDPYFRGIHDSNGDLLPGTTNDDADWNTNSRVFFTPEVGGIHYIAAGAAGDDVGTYRISVTEFADDYLANSSTTGAVAVGGSTAGDIESPGDRDWFAVTLQAGTAYQIDVEGTPTGQGSLRDPYLRGIYDSSGTLLPGTTDDSSGVNNFNTSNGRIAFVPDADGIYYIAAGSLRGPPGTYRVFVRELDRTDDDYTADASTTGTVAVGGSVTGDIELPNDRDWFEVTLEADTLYRIDLEGSYTNQGTLYDPYLRGVYDSNGDLLPGTTNDEGGNMYNSRVYVMPEADGTYYIAAGGDTGRTGTYRLSVRDTGGTDDYTRSTSTTGTVAVGGSTTGDIEYVGDHDWFGVTLEADTTYRIGLEGWSTWPERKGTLRDPYLRGIHDSDGNLLPGTKNDNAGYGTHNSRVVFTPEDPGTYYIAAGAGHHWNGGTYELSIEEVI